MTYCAFPILFPLMFPIPERVIRLIKCEIDFRMKVNLKFFFSCPLLLSCHLPVRWQIIICTILWWYHLNDNITMTADTLLLLSHIFHFVFFLFRSLLCCLPNHISFYLAVSRFPHKMRMLCIEISQVTDDAAPSSSTKNYAYLLNWILYLFGFCFLTLFVWFIQIFKSDEKTYVRYSLFDAKVHNAYYCKSDYVFFSTLLVFVRNSLKLSWKVVSIWCSAREKKERARARHMS